jgi:hypothetical protein
MSPKEKKLIELAEKVKEWVESPDGQEKLREALRNSEEMTTKLRQACSVDPRTMNDQINL